MVRNPSVTDPTREHRVRERAYHLWEADGKPHGRDVEYWERARELVGTEESVSSARSPDATPPDRLRRTAEPVNGQEKSGMVAGQSMGRSEATPTPTVKRRSRPPARRSKT
jgi:Protein of unknown function (DUF2934)